MAGWVLYLLKCRDGSLYTGVTTNPERRLQKHNAGKGGAYTRSRRPVKMLLQEVHHNRGSALRREAQIKSWPRQKKVKLLLKVSPVVRGIGTRGSA